MGMVKDAPPHTEKLAPAFTIGAGVTTICIISTALVVHGEIPSTLMVSVTIPLRASACEGVYVGFSAPALVSVPVPLDVQVIDE